MISLDEPVSKPWNCCTYVRHADLSRGQPEVERQLSVVAELEAVESVNRQRDTRLHHYTLPKGFIGKQIDMEEP